MKKVLIVFANGKFYLPFTGYAALAKHLNSLCAVIKNSYTVHEIEAIYKESGTIGVGEYELKMEWYEIK